MERKDGKKILAHFKREFLKVLLAQAREIAAKKGRLEKAFCAAEKKAALLAKSRGFPVGTVHVWKGRKFKKIRDGVWRQIWDGESRGALAAIARLCKKVLKINSLPDLMNFALEHKQRFSDANGIPLECVKKLRAVMDARIAELEGLDSKGGGNGGGKPPKSMTSIRRKKLAEKLKGHLGRKNAIANEKTNVKAYISRDSVEKFGSGTAIAKSKENGFTVAEHFEVAENVVDLFKKADFVASEKDREGRSDILSWKYFECPTTLENGKRTVARISVRETKDAGHRIYSIEALELKNAPLEAGRVPSPTNPELDFNSIIPQSEKNVKRNPQKNEKNFAPSDFGGRGGLTAKKERQIAEWRGEIEKNNAEIKRLDAELAKIDGQIETRKREQGANYDVLANRDLFDKASDAREQKENLREANEANEQAIENIAAFVAGDPLCPLVNPKNIMLQNKRILNLGNWQFMQGKALCFSWSEIKALYDEEEYLYELGAKDIQERKSFFEDSMKSCAEEYKATKDGKSKAAARHYHDMALLCDAVLADKTPKRL